MSSSEALAACRNLHAGKRAFVLGNGPSLKISDLDRLKNEITFAANKIYLAYNESDWRPTYWCCSDKIVAQNIKDKVAEMKHVKFGAFCVEDSLAQIPFTYIVDKRKAKIDLPILSDMNLLAGVHPGVSVVIFMLKLAFWMGVELVYLLGVDFDFDVPTKSITDEKVFGNNVIISQGERNHFHPDYRKPGEKWTVPLLSDQRREFALMRFCYEIDGRMIINASRKTKLNVFYKANLDDVLEPI
jgi:hypothetical protein